MQIITPKKDLFTILKRAAYDDSEVSLCLWISPKFVHASNIQLSFSIFTDYVAKAAERFIRQNIYSWPKK